MTDASRVILRDNLRALLSLQPGESGVQRLIAKGIANGTAQRLLGGDTSVGLDVLDRLAALFGVPAWRLLAPSMGAEPMQLAELLRVALSRVEQGEASTEATGAGQRDHRAQSALIYRFPRRRRKHIRKRGDAPRGSVLDIGQRWGLF